MSSPSQNPRQYPTKLLVRISEPWDFEVEGGDNAVGCRFESAVGDDPSSESWLLRSAIEVTTRSGARGRLILASGRHVGFPLHLIQQGAHVGVNFALVPAEAEPCSPQEAPGRAVPLGIGSIAIEE
jgi:hypothetical protein